VSAEPRAEPLDVPALYGSTARLLAWADVRTRLEEAPQYWLATTRPDGRPHTVPTDGLWIDEAWWFGGSPETVKHRNLTADGRASLHLPDAVAAVIVEGTCEVHQPDGDFAGALVHASERKYGHAPPVSAYLSGVWRLRPLKVMAWASYPADATRFRFPRLPTRPGG
jgi:hypothetical protein